MSHRTDASIAEEAGQLLLASFNPPAFGIPEAVKEATKADGNRTPGILAKVRSYLGGQSVTYWETTATAQEAADTLIAAMTATSSFGKSTLSTRSPNTGKKKAPRRVA